MSGTEAGGRGRILVRGWGGILVGGRGEEYW